jgi:branched-chain amino acid transport system substrate-binding protein
VVLHSASESRWRGLSRHSPHRTVWRLVSGPPCGDTLWLTLLAPCVKIRMPDPVPVCESIGGKLVMGEHLGARGRSWTAWSRTEPGVAGLTDRTEPIPMAKTGHSLDQVDPRAVATNRDVNGPASHITHRSILKRPSARHSTTAVLSALTLFAVAACGYSAAAWGASGSGRPDGITAVQMASITKTVRVGIITANTGPIAAAGKEFDDGAIIAVNQVNQGNLIGGGTKMALVGKEAAEDPATAASDAAQFGQDRNIAGLICCILSPVVGAVKPIVVKDKLPTDIWGATDTGLADPPYLFRTVTMPQPANELTAKQVAKQAKVKTVAYSVMTDNAGIVSQANAFKQGFNSVGVKDLGQVGTLSTQTSFASAATSLMGKNPGAIVVMATQSVELGVIDALHAAGYKGQVVAGETVAGQGVYQAQPQAITNVPFPVYFLASDPPNSIGRKFVSQYVARFHSQPDDYAAQGWGAAYTMAMGIKAAGKGSVTRASLSKALSGLTTLPNTIYGTVKFSGGQLSASSNVRIVHYAPPNGNLVAWHGKPIN